MWLPAGRKRRKQTISQLFGVLAGTLVCVPAYMLIVSDPTQLGSAELPAPAAQVWAGVAEMLAKGFEALPQGAVPAMFVGGGAGHHHYLGREYTAPVSQVDSLGHGPRDCRRHSGFQFDFDVRRHLLAWILFRSKPTLAGAYTIPVSSGLIAGESLMGVAIIFVQQGPGMLELIRKSLFG